MIVKESDFTQMIMNHAASKGIVRQATIEITNYCNYRCPHCYIAGSNTAYIDITSYKKIIDELYKGGCIWLLITGGEPFLHRAFIEMYRYASAKMKVTVFSIGYKLNDEIIDLFIEIPPDRLEFSIYGATEKTYDEFTGIAGSFGIFMDNMIKLKKNKVAFTLKVPIMKYNWAELHQMETIAKKLNVRFRTDAFILPSFHDQYYARNIRVDPASVIDYEMSTHPELFRTISLDNYSPTANLWECNAGENSLHIDAFRRISVCGFARSKQIQWIDNETTITDAQKKLLEWKSSFGAIDNNSMCAGCNLRAICRFCPEINLMENGDSNCAISWNCEYAHLFADKKQVMETKDNVY